MKTNSSSTLVRFLVLVFVINLFGFKINLIDFGGSGIRLDDLLFIPVVAIILISLKEARIHSFFLGFFVFLLISMISVILGGFANRISVIEGMFYWLRNIQYVSFFFIGYIVATEINLDRIFKIYLFYALFIVALQAYGLMPTFSLFVDSGRAIANTGGPYELAVIASLLAFFFWYRRAHKIYIILAVTLIFLTQSRITTSAFVIIFWLICLNFRRKLISFLLVFSITLLIFLLSTNSFISVTNINIFDRFSDFFDSSTSDFVKMLLNSRHSFRDTWEYRDWAFVNFQEELLSKDGDISSFIRFTRWAALYHSTTACGIECVLLGLGPSFGSSAVDGNYVRFFIEFGIFGVLSFIFGLWRVVKKVRNPVVFSYFLILVISAVAIDIFVASKPMCLFWFLCGVYIKRQHVDRKNMFVPLGQHVTSNSVSLIGRIV